MSKSLVVARKAEDERERDRESQRGRDALLSTHPPPARRQQGPAPVALLCLCVHIVYLDNYRICASIVRSERARERERKRERERE